MILIIQAPAWRAASSLAGRAVVYEPQGERFESIFLVWDAFLFCVSHNCYDFLLVVLFVIIYSLLKPRTVNLRRECSKQTAAEPSDGLHTVWTKMNSREEEWRSPSSVLRWPQTAGSQSHLSREGLNQLTHISAECCQGVELQCRCRRIGLWKMKLDAFMILPRVNHCFYCVR